MSYADRKFIGREGELALLEKWLRAVESPQWFLAVTGNGGIGKSQLIENFADAKRNDKNTDTITSQLIDLYWTAHQTETGILRNLASQLGNDTSFSTFHELLGNNEPNRDTFEELREAFFEGYKQLGQNKTLLVFDTLEVAHGSVIRFFTQTVLQFKSINPNTRFLVAGRWLPNELADCNFVKELQLRGLSSADFSNYFSRVVKGKIPDDVTKRVHTVTMGRPMWAGLFADWTNVGNEPTAIDTRSFEAFRENVLQPLMDLREPEDTLILAIAHLSRRCNESILSHVLAGLADKLGIDIPETVQKLSRFSFVKYREPVGNDLGVCLLHDEMRDLVHDHLWAILDMYGNYRKSWSRKAITYYDEEIRRVETGSQRNTLDLHVLNAERLYYLFHVNPDEAFDCYVQLFARAISTDVLEGLNAEVDAAQKAFNVELTPPLKRQYLLNCALIDHRRERYLNAIEKFSTLDEDPGCEVELLANARWRLAMSYTLNGEVQKAIERVSEWEAWLKGIIRNVPVSDDLHKMLIRQLASLHSQFGQAYRKQGNPSLAVENYNKALELYYQSGASRDVVANTRTNLAGVYLELGFPTKAFDQCKAAYYTYKTIGDPYHLGRVHNVWGLIHDGVLQEDEARENFDKALRYFQEARNRRGQGMCQVAQARMLRREQSYKDKYGKVKPSAEELERNYKRVGDLLDAAIANLKGGDLALLAIALNEKGTLLREKKRFDEAIQFFGESNEVAEKINNNHRFADNLQDMAQAYYQKGDFDTAIKIAEKAVSYRFPQPSGRARRTIANVLFHRGDYDGAFKTICLSCTEIVQVDTGSLSDSPARRDRLFDEWIDWVKELLLKLPSVEQREFRKHQLINCWNEGIIYGEPLSLTHPSFISVLESLSYDDG